MSGYDHLVRRPHEYRDRWQRQDERQILCLEKHEWFETFCEVLGRWIGERGYQRLIGSDNTGTADAAVANAVAQYGHSTGARQSVLAVK
jgi:hypothetical protein